MCCVFVARLCTPDVCKSVAALQRCDGFAKVWRLCQGVTIHDDRTNATNDTEEGLLGLAFHPNFSENGYFYVNYTDYGPKRNVIARYTVSSSNPDQADMESSLVILEVNQPYTNHNGGQMGFGSDGYFRKTMVCIR